MHIECLNNLNKHKNKKINSNIKKSNNTTHYVNISMNLLIFKIVKFLTFVNFPTWKISKIFQILQFQKSSNLHYSKIHKIIKFLKSFNFKN